MPMFRVFRIHRVVCVILTSVGTVTGCASVTAFSVDPNTGQAKTDAAEGIPYFLPAPYLLVTEVPIDAAPESNGKQGGAAADKAAPPAKPDPSKSDAPAPAQGGSGGAPSSASDTSFGMFTKQYGVKLIYLPDPSRPMVLRQHAGLGSAQMNVTLQDGWMLTSLNSAADSKTAETLASIASVIGAVYAGGSGATGTTKALKSGGAGPGDNAASNPPVLPPGLYKIVFDKSGVLSNVCQVVRFATTGIESAAMAQKCK
jgi:hypothetical protein